MGPRIEERLQRAIARLTLFRAIRLVATVALTLAAGAAVLEWIFDPGFTDFRDALWFSVTTVTTVGYGDVVPTNSAGRLIASVLMLAGVSAIPVATSVVVSTFISRAQSQQHEADQVLRQELIERLERIEQALLTRAQSP